MSDVILEAASAVVFAEDGKQFAVATEDRNIPPRAHIFMAERASR